MINFLASILTVSNVALSVDHTIRFLSWLRLGFMGTVKVKTDHFLAGNLPSSRVFFCGYHSLDLWFKNLSHNAGRYHFFDLSHTIFARDVSGNSVHLMLASNMSGVCSTRYNVFFCYLIHVYVKPWTPSQCTHIIPNKMC